MPITQENWTLAAEHLVPEIWASDTKGTYVFNPTMCKVEGGYAVCYRVVQVGSEIRRLATCRLDEDMRPVPGTTVALSEKIEFAQANSLDDRARNWHADPRYFVLDGRIFLSWNDGAAKPINHQFMLEMDASGTKPAGLAREIVTTRERRAIEKNWMFFQADGETYCIYSAFPSDVMAVDMSDSDYIVCSPAYASSSEEGYQSLYGHVRGSAQPIDMGDHFLVLAHSSYKMYDNLRYYVCVAYEMSAKPPFNVTRYGSVPFTLPQVNQNNGFAFEKLNPAVGNVIYPCGIVREGEDVLISYGLNDERAAVARVSISAMSDLMSSAVQTSTVSDSGGMLSSTSSRPNTRHKPKLFWWDSANKSLDGNYGKRKFITGNFGDIASRDIVERVSKMPTQRWVGDGVKLLSVGSILHNARNGDVIWGSGVKGTQRSLKAGVEELDVRSCRGPLTVDVLRSHKIDMSKVDHLFDPGCLVSHLYTDEISSYDVAQNEPLGNIRIIPHYRDDIFFRRLYPQYINSFVSADDTPLGVIQKLLGAEAVFSSSLHGIIFAESLGIPAYWLAPYAGEDTLKYFDYYYGTGRYNIRAHDDLLSAFKQQAPALPRFDHEAYLATFPHDRMLDVAYSGLDIGDKYRLSALRPTEIDAFSELEWDLFDLGQEGLIVKSSSANLRLQFNQELMEPGVLKISFSCTDPILTNKLRLQITAGGEKTTTLEWSPSTTPEQNYEISLPMEFKGRCLDIALERQDDEVPQTIITSVALQASSGLGWLISSTSTREGRANNRELYNEKIRSQYTQTTDEWLLEVSKIPETSAIRMDVRETYVRFLSGAEFLVPVAIIENTHLIFLAGPSASSEESLSRLICFVDGERVPVSISLAPEGKGWRARCSLEELSVDHREFVRVRFDFEESDLNATDTSSLLVRKIAFAKKGNNTAI